jgi:hypothetical protein
VAADASGGDADAGAGGAIGGTARDRLFALRLRINAGRADNHREVVLEHKRLVDPAAEKRERWLQRTAEARRAGLGGAPGDGGGGGDDTGAGEDGEGEGRKRRRPMLESGAAAGAGEGGGAGEGEGADAAPAPAYLAEPAHVAERKAATERDRARREMDSFGWNAYGAAAMHRAHDKRIAALPPVSGDGGSRDGGFTALLAPGMALLPSAAGGRSDASAAAAAAAAVRGASGVVDPAGVDRMVAELAATDARRATFHRRRRIDEAAPFVTEQNRAFVAKVNREMGAFAVDAKQALERGTA